MAGAYLDTNRNCKVLLARRDSRSACDCDRRRLPCSCILALGLPADLTRPLCPPPPSIYPCKSASRPDAEYALCLLGVSRDLRERVRTVRTMTSVRAERVCGAVSELCRRGR